MRTVATSVLVSAPPRDAHAAVVGAWLEARGVSVVRLSAGHHTDGRLSFNPAEPSSYLRHVAPANHRRSQILWLRRLTTAIVSGVLSPAAQDICRNESRAISGGVIAALCSSEVTPNGIRCVDRLESVLLAEYKLLQLKTALSIGANVPESLVTNDPLEVEEFQSRGPTLAKSLSVSWQLHPFVDRLPTDLISSVEAVPVLIQREVDAVSDIRILVCGDSAIAWQRDRVRDEPLDWRRQDPHGKRFRWVQVDSAHARLATSIVRSLNLSTSVQDWVVDRDGRLWFLESNPQGAWLFLENAEQVATPLFGAHLIEGNYD